MYHALLFDSSRVEGVLLATLLEAAAVAAAEELRRLALTVDIVRWVRLGTRSRTESLSSNVTLRDVGKEKSRNC